MYVDFPSTESIASSRAELFIVLSVYAVCSPEKKLSISALSFDYSMAVRVAPDAFIVIRKRECGARADAPALSRTLPPCPFITFAHLVRNYFDLFSSEREFSRSLAHLALQRSGERHGPCMRNASARVFAFV